VKSLPTLGILVVSIAIAACDDSMTTPPADAGLDGSDGDAEVEPELLECDYPDDGYGFIPERVLAPFFLETCEEELTSLPRLWCGQSATIVHLSATWCYLCQTSTALILRDVMAHLEGEDVALVEVLIEGAEHGVVATPSDCSAWSAHLAEDLITYIPHDGELTGPLGEFAHELAPPSTLLLDRHGVIRFRSQLVLPDRIEGQTHQLLVEVQELLAE
jgi:hypothetical protein